MINPVMSFNVEFALRLAERLRPYNLRWLEEPLPPHDIEGHAELKRAITWIPLATGEDHRGRHAFAQLIERRAIDIVQPDIGWSGGITETMKIYTIAETAGIQTIPHGGAVSPWGQHVAMAAPRITHRRMLDRITTRHTPRRNEPHPRNGNRQRRLYHTIQRPRLRNRNPPKLDPKLAIQKPPLDASPFCEAKGGTRQAKRDAGGSYLTIPPNLSYSKRTPCHSERSEESPPFAERKGVRGMLRVGRWTRQKS